MRTFLEKNDPIFQTDFCAPNNLGNEFSTPNYAFLKIVLINSRLSA